MPSSARAGGVAAPSAGSAALWGRGRTLAHSAPAISRPGRQPTDPSVDDAGQLQQARRWEVLLTDAYAERGERVLDGVGERRRCHDGAALTHPPKVDVAVVPGLEVVDFDRRDVGRRRDEVVHERAGEELALLVVGRVLEQHAPDALGDAASDLAFDDGWVDDPPAVLDHDVAQDLHRSGG